MSTLSTEQARIMLGLTASTPLDSTASAADTEARDATERELITMVLYMSARRLGISRDNRPWVELSSGEQAAWLEAATAVVQEMFAGLLAGRLSVG